MVYSGGDISEVDWPDVHELYQAVLHGNLHTKKICMQTLYASQIQKDPVHIRSFASRGSESCETGRNYL